VTLIVGAAMFGIAQAAFPPIAPFVALPFLVLAVVIAVRQWRGTSAAEAEERLAALRAMAWEKFSECVADAYRRRGFGVSPAERPGYDLTITKGGHITLVQCRRWKVNQVGVGPVRDLVRAVEREEAERGICISAGSFSDPARELAARERVTLLSGLELAELIGPLEKRDPTTEA
jgi:restriction system protein